MLCPYKNYKPTKPGPEVSSKNQLILYSTLGAGSGHIWKHNKMLLLSMCKRMCTRG
jgi:hypothetical protein